MALLHYSNTQNQPVFLNATINGPTLLPGFGSLYLSSPVVELPADARHTLGLRTAGALTLNCNSEAAATLGGRAGPTSVLNTRLDGAKVLNNPAEPTPTLHLRKA